MYVYVDIYVRKYLNILKTRFLKHGFYNTFFPRFVPPVYYNTVSTHGCPCLAQVCGLLPLQSVCLHKICLIYVIQKKLYNKRINGRRRSIISILYIFNVCVYVCVYVQCLNWQVGRQIGGQIYTYKRPRTRTQTYRQIYTYTCQNTYHCLEYILKHTYKHTYIHIYIQIYTYTQSLIHIYLPVT